MNQIHIFLVPPDVVGGEWAQRNYRELLLAREFESGAHQLTSDSMPREFCGDFRVDEDELARHTPICQECGLTADVRLEPAIHLVVRDIEAGVRVGAHRQEQVYFPLGDTTTRPAN